ncbi:MAG: C4-type zinc ribbon domain-containing protein [Actinomycetota bacterium]|nr:C4-type zinc ribbon domain-containing protein [Actinomycetota bacterium]
MDAQLSQLDHRLESLPEAVALAELVERREDVQTASGRAMTEVADLSREQRKADADVEQVKSRRQRNQDRLDGGLVADPKQLQAMQHEAQMLERRINDLEDAELEVMERLEQAQAEEDRLAAELATLDEQVREQTNARDDATGEISRQRSDAGAERELLVVDIPADLLALYDRLRAQLGGVGVGALHQKRCEGCRLDVGGAELARIAAAPSNEVLRCEECDRILVRTHESGL